MPSPSWKHHDADQPIVQEKNLLDYLRNLFRGTCWRTTVLLIITPFLLTTWKYFASVPFLFVVLAPSEQRPIDLASIRCGDLVEESLSKQLQMAELVHFGLSVLMLGIIPCVIIRSLFRHRLSDYGIQFGDWKRGLAFFAIFAPLFLASAYVASNHGAIVKEYPLDRIAGSSESRFALHAIGYFCFYLSWEIYFRGFVQFGLSESMGRWNAILIQTALSCLLHIGKPPNEIYGSILGGILWGILAGRTRSILCCVLLHSTLGIFLDFSIAFLR